MFKIFLASIQPLPLSNMDQEKYWTSVPSENAQQSKMRRGTGVTSPLFSVDLPVVEKKKNHTHTHIQMWLVLCICIHSTMETAWMPFSGDLCISLTAASPQYAEVAHLDRSYPGFHILNGSWDTRELSHSGEALYLIRLCQASEASCTCDYRPF